METNTALYFPQSLMETNTDLYDRWDISGERPRFVYVPDDGKDGQDNWRPSVPTAPPGETSMLF
jgi:hypothetical protein